MSRRQQGHPSAPAASRIVRVAELLDADTDLVRRHAARMPARLSVIAAEVAAGTLLTLELDRPWWDRRPRWQVLAGLTRRLQAIEADTGRRTVVAAAITAGHQVLVAQRSHPAALAGQWEFPGGKLERGETPAAALIRECAEELGCAVVVGPELGRQRLADGAELILFQASLRPGSAEPAALEHQLVRWVAAAELAQLDWIPTNRQYVAQVTARI